MEKNSRVNLPDAWNTTTLPGPTAVAVLVRHCHVGDRIADYMYASGGRPKMNVKDLLEDSKAWSSGERRLVLAVVNLFSGHCDVPVGHLAGGLDNRNWDAFMAALRQYRRA